MKGKLAVSPVVGMVEIRVDFETRHGAPTEGQAWLYCVPCGRELVANQDQQLFECPDCEFGVTSVEVSDLCARHILAIDRTFGALRPEKRGLLWRFTRWLRGRRVGQRALESSSRSP